MNRLILGSFVAVAALLAAAPADDYVMTWYVIDGGGGLRATSGDFILSGGVGQTDPDPVALAGADWTLSGGFWAGVAPTLGDLNCDGYFDGFDIDLFFQALEDPEAWQADYPDCELGAADVNYDGYVDGFDIDVFFALLQG